MTALLQDATPCTTGAVPEPVAPSSGEGLLRAAGGRVTATRSASRSAMLDLSRSRTCDAALDILKAYKLSGNFYINLEAVLKDLGFHDMVTYQVESHPVLDFPDCRHVVFKARDDVPGDRFDAIVRSINDRIGFDVPWWVRLLRRIQPEAPGKAPVDPTSPRH